MPTGSALAKLNSNWPMLFVPAFRQLRSRVQEHAEQDQREAEQAHATGSRLSSSNSPPARKTAPPLLRCDARLRQARIV